MKENNTGFLKRADAFIALANEQLNQNLTQGEISASFMYGSARFSAWMAASSFESAEDMKAELNDLTLEERTELNAYVLSLNVVAEEGLEAFIANALDWVFSTYALVTSFPKN